MGMNEAWSGRLSNTINLLNDASNGHQRVVKPKTFYGERVRLSGTDEEWYLKYTAVKVSVNKEQQAGDVV